eukprot:1195795-Rhodomonas_salina.1
MMSASLWFTRCSTTLPVAHLPTFAWQIILNVVQRDSLPTHGCPQPLDAPPACHMNTEHLVPCTAYDDVDSKEVEVWQCANARQCNILAVRHMHTHSRFRQRCKCDVEGVMWCLIIGTLRVACLERASDGLGLMVLSWRDSGRMPSSSFSRSQPFPFRQQCVPATFHS